MRFRFRLFSVATVLAAAFAAAIGASVGPLVTVSGPSPYASCTSGGTPSSTVYANGEVEPSVAVDPAATNVVIGAWQQDRWSDGGARGLVAGYSVDGGASWAETPLPFDACSGGTTYERATDPWVSIGPDGRAYVVSDSFNASNNANAILSSTSVNGGQTWSSPSTVIADNASNFQFFNDKESVTADPVHGGTAYAVWDRLSGPSANPDASLHLRAFKGPGMFSKTTDGGQTWSTPQIIVPTAQNQQTIGNQIVVDSNTDTLYDFFDWIVPPSSRPYNVAFVKSTDGGATWTAPKVVSSELTVGVTDPNTGQQLRTGDIIPEPAIDPATGRLYAVWQDSRFNGGNYDEVALSTSNDGGSTWSAPIRVNTPSGKAAFTPMVRVSSNGTVGVTYYDLRSLGSETTTLPTDYWFTSSTNHGTSFGGEQHVKGPFDMLTAPNASGFFTGDYEALDVIGTTFESFFVATNSGNTANPTDVFATRVTP